MTRRPRKKEKPQREPSAAPAVPDYTKRCGHHGGHMSDILPQPPMRKWPAALAHGIKRRVRVNVARYYGIGQHYYASLSEEDNPVWQTRLDKYDKEPHWVEPWEDPAGRGRIVSKRCNTPEEASRYINHMLAIVFKPETHVPEFSYDDEFERVNGKWFYKEGD